jgi:hypothetical protein
MYICIYYISVYLLVLQVLLVCWKWCARYVVASDASGGTVIVTIREILVNRLQDIETDKHSKMHTYRESWVSPGYACGLCPSFFNNERRRKIESESHLGGWDRDIVGCVHDG